MNIEHRTSNAQRRILNKVFRLFLQVINRRSEVISSFEVQRSMLDVGRLENGRIFSRKAAKIAKTEKLESYFSLCGFAS
jgi:hypothetical protein